MDTAQWIMLALILTPLGLLSASLCLELIVDIIKNIIKNIKGDN